MQETIIYNLIEKHGWGNISLQIITREGYRVDTSTDIWHLPCLSKNHSTINFLNISEPYLRWTTKKYIQEKVQTTSSHAGYASFQDIYRIIFSQKNKNEFIWSNNVDEIKELLISLMEKAIAKAREKHCLWSLYRLVQWYIWCAENYPELGFCSAYALELDCMILPGNPKGEAVRMEESNKGPLHRSLELPLLIKALRDDVSQNFEHKQQKAAVAISIALGRNPANLTFLKETDLINLTSDATDACYIIKMPRIKKRQVHPRDDLLEEYLDPAFAKYIQDLIEANQAIKTTVHTNQGVFEINRPLFIKTNGNKVAIASGVFDDSFNMTASEISELLKSFVNRHNIVSPVTNKMLYLTTRRLRYTLATTLAAEGISKQELARILDHSDTQHVQVYFELAGNIVEHLDKAAAKGFAKYLQFFKGNIIENDNEAINGHRGDKHLAFINESDPTGQIDIGVCGENSICHLDPPFSCYICPKFQPYKDADHEHVLECLLASRDERVKKYETARLGVQLDNVIFAVAQVVQECKRIVTHV